uniref:Uncharacterized protein n=1 Tax=Anguilla anguilla TaxID=7936 RepID=A0A0E9TWD1_ANGAN
MVFYVQWFLDKTFHSAKLCPKNQFHLISISVTNWKKAFIITWL